MNIDYSFINPFILFLLGMLTLYFSSEIIIDQSVLISQKYNISKLLVGVFIMAFGTSLPELFVSILAIINNSNGIVIGNIIGSNIANVCLVLGSSIILKPIVFKYLDKGYYFNLITLFLSTFLFIIFLFDNVLSKYDGFILILSCFIYLYVFINYFGSNGHNSSDIVNNGQSFLKLFFGFLLIYFGSDFFVNGAIGISDVLGVKDLAVGMTIVSIGTSAPEMFTTLLAFKNNEKNLALGNIIGSNIFNILLVGGVSSLIRNINIDFNQIILHSNLLVLVTIVLILLILFSKKISRIFGIIFISIYLIFILINFYNFN